MYRIGVGGQKIRKASWAAFKKKYLPTRYAETRLETKEPIDHSREVFVPKTTGFTASDYVNYDK